MLKSAFSFQCSDRFKKKPLLKALTKKIARVSMMHVFRSREENTSHNLAVGGTFLHLQLQVQDQIWLWQWHFYNHNFDFDFVFMEEVDPIQPVPTGDIIVNAFEFTFDAKGSRSSACNESIWFEFDPTFSLKSGAGAGAGVGGDVNVVHSTSTSTPLTFISFSLSSQPIN